jgi:hypothetical protein
MGWSPFTHVVVDGRGLLTRPWALWVERVQRLINDMQVRPVSGAAQTVDWAAGDEYHLTLTADCTVAFVNPVSGGRYILVVQQDATGGWTVTWPATVVWAGGSPPTLSTAAGALDQVEFLYLAATDQYLGTVALGFA